MQTVVQTSMNLKTAKCLSQHSSKRDFPPEKKKKKFQSSRVKAWDLEDWTLGHGSNGGKAIISVLVETYWLSQNSRKENAKGDTMVTGRFFNLQ